MADIINIENYRSRKKTENKILQELNLEKTRNMNNGEILIYEIKQELRNLKQKNESLDEKIIIEKIAEKIRNASNLCNPEQSVPIVKLAKFLNLTVISTTLEKGKDGYIYAGGTTKDVYGYDPVIVVSRNIQKMYQRFIIAHEIGHYIFDYLPNKYYDNRSFLFSEPYNTKKYNTKKDNNTLADLRADFFAEELLMPKMIFMEKYNKAIQQFANSYLANMYLSYFFGTEESSIIKRKKELELTYYNPKLK